MRLPFWEKFFRPRSAAEVPRLQDLWLHRLKSLHDHAVLCIVGSHWHVLSPLAYWCQGDIVRLLRWDVAKSLGTDWIGLGSTKQFTVTWMLTICRSSSSIPCLSSSREMQLGTVVGSSIHQLSCSSGYGPHTNYVEQQRLIEHHYGNPWQAAGISWQFSHVSCGFWWFGRSP